MWEWSSKAALLLAAGWSQSQVGVEVGAKQNTVSGWISELPEWADSIPDAVERAVADMTPTAAAAVEPMVTEWRDEQKLRDRDQRDADRLRMAINGWDQFRKFRTHKRRDHVLARRILLGESHGRP